MRGIEHFPTVYFSTWLLIVSVAADPSVCYYCTTEADGTSCDDPINEKSIRIQSCDNFTVTRNTGSLPTGNTDSTVVTGTYACTKLTYYSIDNKFVTIRECQSRQIQGMDICSYLNQSSVTRTNSINFNCHTCYSDLCNSAVSLHFSAAGFVCFILMKFMVFLC